MKRALVFLMLTACAPSAPVFRPVAVEIPVSAPCAMKAVSKPDFAMSHASPTDDIAQKTKAALEEIFQRKAYESFLESQIASCQ